jgi:hypothetical protein
MASIGGTLLMGLLSFFYDINLSLAIIGLILLIIEIFFTIRKIIIQKRINPFKGSPKTP